MKETTEEDGNTGALRILKMCAENPKTARSIIDSILDAALVGSKYNNDFLSTIAAFAIEGWKRA